jgi:starch synthase
MASRPRPVRGRSVPPEMRVLSVVSELYPFVKTGGLADVAGALPPALTGHGVDMRSLLPAYPAVLARAGWGEVVHHWPDYYGGEARIRRVEAEGHRLFLLDAPHLYDRPGGPYGDPSGVDFPDNWRRFAALSRAGADIARGLLFDFRPDIVHAHDWQTALAAAFVHYDGTPGASVVTIHNLAFQGQFDAAVFPELGLPADAFSIHGVEYYGGVGFLKAGLRLASAITTVSPTYAEEIRTPDGGMGLDGLLADRVDDLSGIVNGIDTAAWDPATDPHLPARFTADDPPARLANRRALEERFGLHADDAPLFSVVSRLTWQKGIDLLAETADHLTALGGKLAVLGTGDPGLEHAFREAAARHPGRIGAIIGYDEALAHLVQGGADAILIPSRFEPCGLTQLYGLRYGSVPVVARVGGLADTVIDANHAALVAGVATGIQFTPVDVSHLRKAIRRAVHLYQTPGIWTRLRREGMKADVSWDHSAAAYAALYRDLLDRSRR